MSCGQKCHTDLFVSLHSFVVVSGIQREVIQTRLDHTVMASKLKSKLDEEIFPLQGNSDPECGIF